MSEMYGTVRRVVVGVNGDVGSLEALRRAVDLAQGAGVPLVAVNAWQPAEVPMNGTRVAFPPDLCGMWQEVAMDTLTLAFEEALGGAPDDLDVRLRAERGFAGSVLVDEASRPGDMLVVGAGTHGRLYRLLRGSVSRYCTGEAHCPVLVVPPPALAREYLSTIEHTRYGGVLGKLRSGKRAPAWDVSVLHHGQSPDAT